MPVTNLEAGVTTDWRGFVARWQVQMDDWDTVARGDLQFFVESEVGAGGDRARTVYDVGGQANTSTVTPPWNRMEIDLDKDATGFTGTGPADLSAVQWFGWIVNRPDTVQVTRYGDFFLLEKSKRPILVEMTNYRRFQDGAGPSGPSGPSYQISMEMLEVTS